MSAGECNSRHIYCHQAEQNCKVQAFSCWANFASMHVLCQRASAPQLQQLHETSPAEPSPGCPTRARHCQKGSSHGSSACRPAGQQKSLWRHSSREQPGLLIHWCAHKACSMCTPRRLHGRMIMHPSKAQAFAPMLHLDTRPTKCTIAETALHDMRTDGAKLQPHRAVGHSAAGAMHAVLQRHGVHLLPALLTLLLCHWLVLHGQIVTL